MSIFERFFGTGNTKIKGIGLLTYQIKSKLLLKHKDRLISQTLIEVIDEIGLKLEELESRTNFGRRDYLDERA